MFSNLLKVIKPVRRLQSWVILRFVCPKNWSHGKCRERKMIIICRESKKPKDGNTNISRMADVVYLFPFNVLKFGSVI